MVVRQTSLQQGIFAASQDEINNIKQEDNDFLEDLDFGIDPMLCDDHLGHVDINLDDNFDLTIEDLLNLC